MKTPFQPRRVQGREAGWSAVSPAHDPGVIIERYGRSDVANKKIAIACDHRGFEIKSQIGNFLKKSGYEVIDCGTDSADSCDYPDYMLEAAAKVRDGVCFRAVGICHSGIGSSIVSNKVEGVRAALCHDPQQAQLSRAHNDSNMLILASGVVDAKQAEKVLETWLKTAFEGGRHERRVEKIKNYEKESVVHSFLRDADPDIYRAIAHEIRRQNDNIELIASENFTSTAVLEAAGSVLTNKYAEGYPAKRWYGGCEYVDVVEQLAIDRAKALFGAEHANVQPHSGTNANIAVFMALLSPGDKILAMDLSHGGHLSHGHRMNFSGKFYGIVSYGVSPTDEKIDYNQIEQLALEHKPRLILLGASAYPRIIDFKRGREIADKVGAFLMVDMAHFAGLVASGHHPSPVPYADVVTTTTHKTLRGPRAGLILCREAHAKAIDAAVFPGSQGGPLMHIIAAKAVALKEAMSPDFKDYCGRIVVNAKTLASAMADRGWRIVSGGTDNHLLLVDVTSKGWNGKDVQDTLDRVRITVNKNMIPFDKLSPFKGSGVRLGTPAVTTRGMGEKEMVQIADMIDRTLKAPADEAVLEAVRNQVRELVLKFPLYPELLGKYR